jgi:hypothetical protein
MLAAKAASVSSFDATSASRLLSRMSAGSQSGPHQKGCHRDPQCRLVLSASYSPTAPSRNNRPSEAPRPLQHGAMAYASACCCGRVGSCCNGAPALVSSLKATPVELSARTVTHADCPGRRSVRVYNFRIVGLVQQALTAERCECSRLNGSRRSTPCFPPNSLSIVIP